MVTFVAVLFKSSTKTTKAQLDGWSRTLNTSDIWFYQWHTARLTVCQSHHHKYAAVHTHTRNMQ